ncbi:MAG: orotate phosphoribosyltransferase [Clostridiaceae bacterium]|jgi:orotate phosphoribosyltransferase|nr:orotate phosphoribosyltransferase [Clostridiaceae bacterium]
MKNSSEALVKSLFETNAIRVCPAKSPFWYTSGKIGPYYINTHFLYGSEEKANDLLRLIDTAKENKPDCSAIVFEKALENYKTDIIYKNCIDTLLEAIDRNITAGSYDYISGGERRDWFFSLIVSAMLNKPHITIFKDMDAYVFHNGKCERIDSLQGAQVLHIADLITSASSYERSWMPVIRNASGVMKSSYVIIDRMQGGHELLKSMGVASHSLVRIDSNIFKGALEKQYIDEEQFQMVTRYMEDPDGFMKDFFLENPDFLEKALHGDEKTAQRARLCIEKGFNKTSKT